MGYLNLFTWYFCRWRSRNWVTTEDWLVQLSWVGSWGMNRA